MLAMAEIPKGFYQCAKSLRGIQVRLPHTGQSPENVADETLAKAQDLQSLCKGFKNEKLIPNGPCPEDCQVNALIDFIKASRKLAPQP